MTMAERVQLQRAEEQIEAFPLRREARRVECACGCGEWFTQETALHRPVKYATRECRLKVKRESMAAHRASRRGQ